MRLPQRWRQSSRNAAHTLRAGAARREGARTPTRLGRLPRDAFACGVRRSQAILNALEIYDNLKETGKLAPKRRPEDFGPGDGPK